MDCSRLRVDRYPRSLEETLTLVAYNERILRTSLSEQRRHRASQMLTNLQPFLTRFQADAAPNRDVRPATSVHGDGVEFESVWNGRDSLDVLKRDRETRLTAGLGSSLSGTDFECGRL